MRVAGVRISDGQMWWVDAGSEDVALLDRVVATRDGVEESGDVLVTPEQWAGAVPHANATLVSLAHPAAVATPCGDMPGSEMPALGTSVTVGDASGAVAQIDPVSRQVVVVRPGGDKVTVAVDELKL